MARHLLPRRGTLVTWTTQEFLPKEPYAGGETEEKGQTFVTALVVGMLLYTTLIIYGVTTMRSVPGSHFTFEWNPTRGDLGVGNLSQYYPGNRYVDELLAYGTAIATDAGVTDIRKVDSVLARMAELGWLGIGIFVVLVVLWLGSILS